MLSRLHIFTVIFLLMCVTSFGQNSYETDVDSAWIASQNGGRTELNDGNNEPNPDCIGDGCGVTTFETRQGDTQQSATANSQDEEDCTPADSANPDCADDTADSTASKKSVTYNEDADALYVNENREIYRARKEGFYTSINLGFRLGGGVNLLFGEKADTWNPGYLGNFGLFVRIPFGAQTFRIMTALDFSYRRYLHEETTEISDNEAYVEMYMFEIPFMLRYIGEDDGFFFGVGGDLGLKLSGFSEFRQETQIEGKTQKDKRDKTIPTNGVELGAVVDFGFIFNSHFGFDIRIVQYFTNLVDEDNLAESTLFNSELWPFNASFGVFYQF